MGRQLSQRKQQKPLDMTPRNPHSYYHNIFTQNKNVHSNCWLAFVVQKAAGVSVRVQCLKTCCTHQDDQATIHRQAHEDNSCRSSGNTS